MRSFGVADGDHRPIAHTINLYGAYSRLISRLILSGSPPPPRPQYWPQRSYLHGTNWVHVDQTQPVDGDFQISATGRFGVPNEGSPTLQHETTVSLTETGPLHPPAQYSSRDLDETNWYSRPVQNQAGWLHPKVDTYVIAIAGEVNAEAESYATAWGIEYSP